LFQQIPQGEILTPCGRVPCRPFPSPHFESLKIQSKGGVIASPYYLSLMVEASARESLLVACLFALRFFPKSKSAKKSTSREAGAQGEVYEKRLICILLLQGRRTLLT
jgi:hypothetical protein